MEDELQMQSTHVLGVVNETLHIVRLRETTLTKRSAFRTASFKDDAPRMTVVNTKFNTG